jgi:S-adenosylmethionine:diacylglycerol 3-amino-3-carboxypropyl transferase
MTTQANRETTSESYDGQTNVEPDSQLSVAPLADVKNTCEQQGGILHFVYRILRDRNLYGSLAFAETAESLRLNMQALQVGPQDRVAGVASSGDLLLAVLGAAPEEVVGFDANNAQIVLSHLKAAAMRSLSVEDYLQFMGVSETDPDARVAMFNRISRSMPSFARRDLLGKQVLIKDGILNHGMTHLIIKVLFACLGKVLRRETLELFLGISGTDAERTGKLYQLQQKKEIRYVLQPLLRIAAPRLKWLFFPHRFCRISSRPDEMIADFFNTFRDIFIKGAQTNPVLCRSAVRKIHPEWHAHLYNDITFQRIRKNISRLSLSTADIFTGLRRLADGWATRIYLSNVPDYLTEAQLAALVIELQRVAAPGARIVYCSLYDQDLLAAVGPPIAQDELEKLQAGDDVFIYPLLMVRTRAAQ